MVAPRVLLDTKEVGALLHVHRAERADGLVGPLADHLAVAPQDAFAPDVVAVPTRGVERWLSQGLSHRLGAGPDGDGVAALVQFPSPARLVGGVLSEVLGVSVEDDPWQRDRLTWHVLEVLDECAGEPWCRALGRHLGVGRDEAGATRVADSSAARRLHTAQHLAGLFTSYGAQRPAMIRAWAEGRDDDGASGPVPADLAWEAEIWRRVRARIGGPSHPERLAEALTVLDDEPSSVTLPSRLSVFGASRLPEEHLAVLTALGRHRDVHLWLPHPSRRLWDRLAGPGVAVPGMAGTGVAGRAERRADVPVVAEHPLLASCARDVTELQRRLDQRADGLHWHPVAEPVGPLTALAAVQRSLRADELPPRPAPHPALGVVDRTIQVHACHGPARQVEVLREVLVGLLDEDPTLEPRDVLVMCPDVEGFAPLVTAVFGAVDDDPEEHSVTHPGRTLRLRLADRGPAATNPHLTVLAALLRLADARVTASEVLDLAAADPVRRRFGWDDDDLDRLRQWAVQSGVHWGEDAGRRQRFGLDLLHGTWRAGLDRVLLGVAMAEEDSRYVGSALPLDDVGSTDIDLAGSLAELVDRLGAVLDQLHGAHPLDHWLAALGEAMELLTQTAPSLGWQAAQVHELLDDVGERAGAARASTPVRLADVRALLTPRLAPRPTRSGFRTGALTVCSLEPMRAVPHRVVVLLGMDDGAFPRTTSADGDDVLLRAPLVGERDRRSEDRQLFLDALTSATDRLVVLYSGADERTGAPRPPAVPVGELLDVLDAVVTPQEEGAVAPAARARDAVVVRQPLQAVDARSFVAGALGRPGPFSFDAVSHRAARAVQQSAESGDVPPAPFLGAALAPDASFDGDVDVADLVRTLEHPVKAFVARRLGVSLAGEDADVDDHVPLVLDGLGGWEVGDRLLSAALDGADLDRARQAEMRRGLLPPRRLGGEVLERVQQQVEPIVRAHEQYAALGPARSVDVRVALPDGRSVVGTVGGLRGDTLVRAVYSRLAAKHRLRAWVQLLALVAADPDSCRRAATIGRWAGTGARASLALHGAPHPDDALRWLGQLVGLRDAALLEPLPLPLAASCAYGRARHAQETVEQALTTAGREFTKAFEHEDDHLRLVHGPELAFGDLLDDVGPAERVWWPEEGTRFGVLSRRMWEPITEHERTETL